MFYGVKKEKCTLQSDWKADDPSVFVDDDCNVPDAKMMYSVLYRGRGMSRSKG